MIIKEMYLATGDMYEDCLFKGNNYEFISQMKKGELISISVDKTEILINSDYIVSVVM